jgi:hypothetical protein
MFNFQFVGAAQLIQYGVYADNGLGTHPTLLIAKSVPQTINPGFTGLLTIPVIGSTVVAVNAFCWIAINGSGASGSLDLWYNVNPGQAAQTITDVAPYPLPTNVTGDAIASTGRVITTALNLSSFTCILDHYPGNIIESMGVV